MFSKGINDTALTTEVADRLFSNITAANALDKSFLATLRVLLHKRLPQNETVRLTCRALHDSLQDITTASVAHSMSWFLQDIAQHQLSASHSIHIIYTKCADTGAKMLEIVKANAGKGKRYMGGFTRQDDLHIYYVRKAKSLFYTDETGTHTVIFTDKLELKQFHALQMMIPKYLPHLFAQSPLTENETNLLKSLSNKSAIEYETWLERFSMDVDIRSEVIRTKLAGFETAYERIRANELRDEISAHQKDYEYYLSMIRDTQHLLQERMYTLAGLEDAIIKQNENSELMEYFMCNKNLTILHAEGTIIKFAVHGYADIYDTDAVERYVANHDGFLYQQIAASITPVQMEKLYRAIFIDDVYKLRICAAFLVDMRKGLRALQHYTFSAESKTYLPNTHINYYGCVGSYAGRFQEYMQKRDYVGAIDQAVVSARNLNFYDSTVMAQFAHDLSHTDITCIETTDGSLLTPCEAIIQLEGGG